VIESADEYKRLFDSPDPMEGRRAVREPAAVETWQGFDDERSLRLLRALQSRLVFLTRGVIGTRPSTGGPVAG
jgi:hypothetical protein